MLTTTELVKRLEQTLKFGSTPQSVDVTATRERAFAAVKHWTGRAAQVARGNPGLCVAGALVLGFAIFKVARHG